MDLATRSYRRIADDHRKPLARYGAVKSALRERLAPPQLHHSRGHDPAVVRVSRASYDSSRFAEVDAASKKTSDYIIPAIRRLPGLLHFYAGVSPKGSIVQVSVWDTDEHAAQLDRLKEMIVDGRRDMEAVGVTFTPIFNYPIDWTWTV